MDGCGFGVWAGKHWCIWAWMDTLRKTHEYMILEMSQEP